VDLVTRVHVAFSDAALGGEVDVASLEEKDDAPHTLSIPAGTQPGAVFTMKGHGIPRLDGRGRGALVIVVQVDVPTALSAKARDLLSQLDAELRGGDAGGEAQSRKRVAGK
jgi:molecular chaperone DnaJ